MKALRIPSVIVFVVVCGRGIGANAQVTETNLYSFGGLTEFGSFTGAGLVEGSDGNFYGTTDLGGTNDAVDGGDGSIFRISPSGIYTTLYSFGSSPTDGSYPGYAAPVQGRDGNIYGTTVYGGANDVTNGGDGIVFRISPSGSYTTLCSFGSSPIDGENPNGLVQGSDGNFYGTCNSAGLYLSGTMFRISPSGTYTSLYSFGSSPNDGENPIASLAEGSDGNFYGTTSFGGTYGGGTVFRISPSGSETNLYYFGNSPTDGENPQAGLVQGSDGNFYGTTVDGGTNNCDCGTVFRISPSGTYTTLYSFGSSPIDGEDVYYGLVQGSDGNFYGVADQGGMYDEGTVFRMSPSGTYTSLYSFGRTDNDGENPRGVLVQGNDGNFYGTAAYGGTGYNGTIYKLIASLKSPSYPINQITGVHRAGTNVIFSIPSIAGETYQLQYRSSMTSGTWSNVPSASITNSIGALLTLTNIGGAVEPQGFYRFEITP